jgi:hypothetical protein
VLEENGITSDVWWGASYRGESASSSGYSTLLYDARGSGFSECTSTVIMLGAHELIDVAEGSKLWWRKEGDKWLDEESIHINDSLRRAGPSFSMQDLLQDQQRLDATEHHGVSVEQVGMAAFAELPSTKQHTLAMGFRHFTEEFKKRLQNLQQERGADYVVTKEDIMDFNEDIRSRRQ